jgi:hypothetical protein
LNNNATYISIDTPAIENGMVGGDGQNKGTIRRDRGVCGYWCNELNCLGSRWDQRPGGDPERGKRLHVHVVRINLLFILSAGSIIFESHNSQERQYSASCEVTDSRGRVVLTHRWQCKEGLQLSSMEKSSMIMASIPVARACDSKFLLIHMKSLDKVMQ